MSHLGKVKRKPVRQTHQARTLPPRQSRNVLRRSLYSLEAAAVVVLDSCLVFVHQMQSFSSTCFRWRNAITQDGCGLLAQLPAICNLIGVRRASRVYHEYEWCQI